MQTLVIAQAVVKCKNKFLIAKRAPAKKNAPNTWEFISGFIDTKETAEEIILREIKEEVNLNGKIISTANPKAFEDKESRWIIIPFLVEVKSEKFTINPSDHSEVKWLSSEELTNYQDISQELKYYQELGWII